MTKLKISKTHSDFAIFYKEETSRAVNKGIKEYQSYIRNREYDKSHICQDAFDNFHKIQGSTRNCTILGKEPTTKNVKLKKSHSFY